MTALSIQPTFPTFTGADGQPLDNGYIWVGTANLNPITNPITVYWDAALSAPATQPIRTLGGYPSNSGTPARLYVNSDYSIQVLDRKGSVVYSAPVATDRYGGGIINANIVVYDPSGTGAVATTVQAKLRESVSVLDFYANGVSGAAVDPTGVLDSTLGIQAALNTGRSVFLPKGNYKISATLKTTTNGQRIYGDGRPGMTVLTWSGPASTAMWATSSATLQVGVSITDMEIISLLVDGFRAVDYTNYCYSSFARLYVQTYGNNCYGTYATGRSGGDGPYYNQFNQIDFSSNNILGVTTGSTGHYGNRLLITTVNWNGPNANRFYGGRIAGASHVAWFLDGVGNVFDSVIGESITVAHYELGSNTPDYTGTFAGGNINQVVTGSAVFTASTLVGGAVTLTAGTGSTALVPTRTILANTTTLITVDPYWAIMPDATSQYAIYAPGCQGNAIVNPYCEGDVSSNPAFLLERPGTQGTELRGGWLVSLGSGLPVNKKLLRPNDYYSPIGWKDPVILTFSKTNITNSLTDSPLLLSGTARATALPAGRFQILGMDVLFSGVLGAGGACQISINGNGLKLPSGSFVVNCDTTTTANNGGSFRQDYFPPGLIIAAGIQNQLGVSVTTGAGFTPSGTMDLVVQVYVQLI